MSAEPISVLRSLSGHAVPLKAVSLAGIAEGCFFELAIEQRYENAEKEAIEAVYTFPLPVKAVLLSFELEIGGRRLAGVVQKRRRAAERYESAVESGDAAALLEQARDGLYTVSLGNLKPGEKAVVRYRYAQLLDFDQGRIRIAIPMAVAPRYGTASDAVDAHHAPSVDPTADYPCTLALTLKGELAKARVHSPTHPLVATSDGPELALTTRCGIVLDRDLVLLVEGLPAAVQALIAKDGTGYVALASMPSPPPSATSHAPKILKLVVDCSGSMASDSIHQARDALLALVSTLAPSDHVSLTRFGSTHEHLTRGLEPVTNGLLLDLNRTIRALNANLGGTEMARALEAVIALPGPPDAAADILLITDGEIWDIDPLIERLAQSRHRLFVIAVGSSPAEELARRIAIISRGSCEFVTPREDMHCAVGRLMAKIGAPIVSVATVAWPAEPEWTVGAGQSCFPGETLHVLAGFDDAPHGSVAVSLEGPAVSTTLACPLAGPIATESSLPRVAAMRRLASLDRAGAASLAERYQLVTEYTSCLVVLEREAGEKTAGDPVLRQVPQMLAAGWAGSSTLLGAGVTRGPIGARASPAVSDAHAALPAREMFSALDAFTQPAKRLPRRARPAGVVDNQRNVVQRLTDLASRRLPLPETIESLRELGVSEPILECLRRIVAEGYAELDVITAWLAVVATSEAGGMLGARLKGQLARAVDRKLRAYVAGALSNTGGAR